MMRTMAWVFAAAFLLVGILGFIPGLSTAAGDGAGNEGHVLLLGLFQINMLHNVFHLVSAALAALAALTSTAMSRLYFIVIGVGYTAVTALALATGGSILGMTHMNMADNLAHLALGLAALAIAFILPARLSVQA